MNPGFHVRCSSGPLDDRRYRCQPCGFTHRHFVEVLGHSCTAPPARDGSGVLAIIEECYVPALDAWFWHGFAVDSAA